MAPDALGDFHNDARLRQEAGGWDEAIGREAGGNQTAARVAAGEVSVEGIGRAISEMDANRRN